ncbi:hypothetical protein JVU11DRAFT_6940 [Chiua virens]|nr:hypothetical protein JVU11DRAFT_6940 [Chiua virens]
MNVFLKEISMNGFVITSLFPNYPEMFKEDILALLASKELIYTEEVTKGSENAEVAFNNFLKGAFIGKSIVVVADEY